MASSAWALSQISRILPLDEVSLQQILDYASAVSKDEAADHLKNILGDSPQALEFISSFNSRREAPLLVPIPIERPSGIQISDATPRRSRKKNPPLNKLPPGRQPEDYGNTSGAYSKKDEENYMAATPSSRKTPHGAFTLSEEPEALQLPIVTSNATSKMPLSAAGSLISDLPNVRTSRTSSPAPKAKVSVSGGPSMHGASTTLQDLVGDFHFTGLISALTVSQDSAIRALELQTNPSLASSPSARRCDCLATRHPLLAAAPNCLSCGKIICVKEGIGPCTFCAQPLLSSGEITTMIRSLREERGQTRMSLNNASHRRADLAQTARPFSTTSVRNPSDPNPPSTSTAEVTLDLARQHRDKLLGFQSENARRTYIIDEAADFETPTSGLSMWSSPVERAAQLKRQQKVLREQEWNAKPDYEKRKMVVSVDLVGGKAVRRMATIDRAEEAQEDDDHSKKREPNDQIDAPPTHGAFSNNPLLGTLIRPVWKSTAPATADSPRSSPWRRVQDDETDNEAWILDGGVYGQGREAERILGMEERACG